MLQHADLGLASCELKFSTRAPGRFEGYASVFGGVDSYGDTIEPGAFAKTIKDRARPPLMLFGHNPGRVIGKWIGMKEDQHGLHVEGEFTPGNTDAQNAYASLKHGALDGLSIGFRIPSGGAEDKKGGGRIIKQADLVEISLVTMPADDSARIQSVKQVIDAIESLKDAEAFLREAGVARSAARDFVSRLSKVIRREGEDVGAQITKQVLGADGVLRRLASLEKLIAR